MEKEERSTGPPVLPWLLSWLVEEEVVLLILEGNRKLNLTDRRDDVTRNIGA